MKIVYLHQYFNGPSGSGSTRSYEMAKRLVARGHEVHIVTSDRTRGGNAWHEESLDGISVHWVPIPYSNKMGFNRRILAFAAFAIRASSKARRLRGDVVLATSTPLTIAIPGIFATLFRGPRLVLEVRDLWPEVPIALGVLTNPLVILLARGLEALAYRRSAEIVALSEGMKEGVVARGFPANRVHVITNASDIDLFSGHAQEAAGWRQRYDWLGQRPLVVHCGTMGFVNGVSYLAEVAAAALLLDPELRFVTVGDGAQEGEVLRRAQELGVLGRNFFMLPPVPKSEVPVIFRAATVTTCLVVPVKALENNSANKIFDAFAAGKPVAINYGGWQEDLLTDSGAGIRLNQADPTDAARGLSALIRDPLALADMQSASLHLATARFNREDLALRLAEVLERVGEVASVSRRRPGLRAGMPAAQ